MQEHSIKQDMQQNSRSINLQCRTYLKTKQEFSKPIKIEDFKGDISLEFEEIGKENILAGTQNHELKEHFCLTCEKSYATKIQLGNHIRYSHGAPSKCTECNMSFQSKMKHQQHTLKKHVRILTPKTIFCQKCGKGFYVECDMKPHTEKCGQIKKRKRKTKVHECEICGKVFIRSNSFLKHMKIHKEKLLTSVDCTVCGQTFSSQKTLESHFKINHMYCTVCGQSFSSQKDLGQHFKINHPDMLTPCNICEKKFLSKRELSQHKRRVHPEVRVICSRCGQSLKTNYALEHHKRTSCGNKKSKPWEVLGERAKRARSKVMIDVISGVINKNPAYYKERNYLHCLHDSLLAMSKNERKYLQDKISNNFHLIGDATGKKILTIEDLTEFFNKELLKNKTITFNAECTYCGEEVKDSSDLENHVKLYHAAQKQI